MNFDKSGYNHIYTLQKGDIIKIKIVLTNIFKKSIGKNGLHRWMI